MRTIAEGIELERRSAALESMWVSNEGMFSSGEQQPCRLVPYGLHHSAYDSSLPLLLQQRGALGLSVVLLKVEPLRQRLASYLNSEPSLPHTRDREEQEEDAVLHEVLIDPTQWASGVVGVVEGVWSSDEERQKLIKQLEFAAFLDLPAVLLPLPAVEEGPKVACLAADIIHLFISSAPSCAVWISCDVCGGDRTRRHFQHVREAVLHGYDEHTWLPLSHTTPVDGSLRREAIRMISPYLSFEAISDDREEGDLLGEEDALSTGWLGEAVAAFDLPPSILSVYEPMQLVTAVHSLLQAYPPAHQLWGAPLPETITSLQLVVELLRRRSVPIFAPATEQSLLPFTFHCLSHLDYIHANLVLNEAKDAYASYENTIQLPLQPLGHQLSNGVYGVFEKDEGKYTEYRRAFDGYVRRWATGGVPSHRPGSHILYAVVLGCGRGPLIQQFLECCTEHQVQAHVFAVEKNECALQYTAWRWGTHPALLSLTSQGHHVDFIAADGRHLFSEKVKLPAEFGWCDVLISELLGSAGDNELSPECIEGFLHEVRLYQASVSVPPNPCLLSIPQSYTTWVAPLHSVAFEQTIMETAVKGLTVCPEGCNRHEAVFHQLFVCNLTQGLVLDAPQELWSFSHPSSPSSADSINSSSRLTRRCVFHINSGRRCSAVVVFFSAVLYQDDQLTVKLSTVPHEATPGMFSWFPCVFTPHSSFSKEATHHRRSDRGVAETGANGGEREQRHVIFEIQRCVEAQEKRVWYEWSLGDEEDTSQLNKSGRDAPCVVMNQHGWASSILL